MRCVGCLFVCIRSSILRSSNQSNARQKLDQRSQTSSDVDFTSLEQFLVLKGSDHVTFSGADVSHTDVPLHILQRSTQLRNTVCNADEDGSEEFQISLPSGVLHCWLSSLYYLGTLENQGGPADVQELDVCTERISDYLKAADFLNDDDCLQRLAFRLESLLFPVSGSSRQVKIAEELIMLPQDLTVHVLRSCKKTRFAHFKFLPPILHLAALHACFPTITACGLLSIPSVGDQEQLDTLVPLLGKLQGITGLEITRQHLTRKLCGDVVAEHIQGPLNLQKMLLSQLPLSVRGSEILGQHLQGLSHLQELTLAGCLTDSKSMHALLPHVSQLRHIRVLDLQENKCMRQCAEALAQVIAHLCELRKLCLSGCELNSYNIEPIVSQLTCLKFLEDLDLSRNYWFPSYMTHVPTLPVIPSLKHLSLQYIGVSANSASDWERTIIHASYPNILRNMDKLAAIQTLNLSGNHFGSLALGGSIGALSSLSTLQLHNCDMQFSDKRDQNSLSSLLQLRGLQRLDLGGNSLLTADIASQNMLKCIGEMSKLTWLSLSGIGQVTWMSASGITAVLFGLQAFQRIHHLDISCSKFSEERPSTQSDCAAILNAICGLTSLRSLNISGTNLCIGEREAHSLCRLQYLVHEKGRMLGPGCMPHIRNMSCLQYLQLKSNFQSPQPPVLCPILAGVSELSCLSFLGLKDCNVKDEQVAGLADEIKHMSALRQLDLRGGAFTADSWGVLMPALNRAPELFQLYVDAEMAILLESFPEAMQYVDLVVDEPEQHTGPTLAEAWALAQGWA